MNLAGIHVALVDGDDIALSANGSIIRAVGSADIAKQLMCLAAGEELSGERDDRITILCCTDSKHDPCCARYGFSTWKALPAHANPAVFRVLQSTHIGGCRFAASILVLPIRARYGRLKPREVPDFLACLQRDELYLPAYRGNPELDAISQVAECAARYFRKDLGFADKVVLDHKSGSEGEGAVEVFASLASQRLLTRLQAETFEVATRRSSLRPGGQTNQVARRRAVSLKPLTEPVD
ncbi:sucrase ferredoxin [Rhizobium sp. PAMB 3174]